MIIGLFGSGAVYLAMIPASTYAGFAVIMFMRGIFNPLYSIGMRSMVADLIPEEQRADAYALTRLAFNVGIALGPAVGGYIATSSYSIALLCGASGLVLFGFIVSFFSRETLPETTDTVDQSSQGLKGYRKIFRDGAFMSFSAAFTLVLIASSMVWVLLGVYAKENFGILENRYGMIAMTNALMVVTLQVLVTNQTKKHPDLQMMTIGAVIYVLGVAGFALAGGFWGFWLCMVILTVGELILMPTATTYVANISPADMRGRYMSIFTLGWGAATGIGPLVGGFLNDNLSPVSIWYGGGVIGLAGVLLFITQLRKKKPSEEAS
jgi:MFS family permease